MIESDDTKHESVAFWVAAQNYCTFMRAIDKMVCEELGIKAESGYRDERDDADLA